MNKELIKDIAVRALKTFLQAFLSVVSLGVVGVVDSTTFKALMVAGVSAGVSAVWNTLLLTKKS